MRDRRGNKSLGQSVVEFSMAIPIFMLVFLVTLFNWQFGNRYVND